MIYMWEVLGIFTRRTGMYYNVHEDSSMKMTTKLPLEIIFMPKNERNRHGRW